MSAPATRPGPGAIPHVPGYENLRHLPGGYSHEAFLAELDGSTVVLRVYGAGLRSRGPEAPSVQRGVLRLAHGLIPVPEVVAFSEGPPATLATSLLPGVPLNTVLETADPELQERLGRSMGEILGRLSGMALSGAGPFLDHQQTLGPLDPDSFSLVTWLDAHWEGTALASLGYEAHQPLSDLCHRGDELLAISKRACLTHGDLNPRNVLCDPQSGTITGVVDWEFTHAGHPVEDAGKLIRRMAGSPFTDAALKAMTPWLPAAEQAPLEQLQERARAADLYWLIELAATHGRTAATQRAWTILEKMVTNRRLLGEL
jgi:Ser/Thr protein kinase RdoA (MazF antagonist)